MAKAEQLPSGSWRIRVYDSETKKRVSFTSQTRGKAGKAEVELMAREYELGKRQKVVKGMTIGECIDEYISTKVNILSPTTIDGYRKSKRLYLQDINDLYVSEITSSDIQNLINQLSRTKSPKTVKNAHGLLIAALNVYAPDLRINTTLPKKQEEHKELPDVREVLQVVIGSDIELECLLAMWCTMRISEIRGLKKSDIKNGAIYIHDTIVTVGAEQVLKHTTKTAKSKRFIRLPQRILTLIDALPKDQEYLTTLSAHALYMRFTRLLEANAIKHMSFHDLRHMNASVMLALGIPDKYAMERGGWSSPAVMKKVYQHTFSAEREAVDDKIDGFFEDIIETLD